MSFLKIYPSVFIHEGLRRYCTSVLIADVVCCYVKLEEITQRRKPCDLKICR